MATPGDDGPADPHKGCSEWYNVQEGSGENKKKKKRNA